MKINDPLLRLIKSKQSDMENETRLIKKKEKPKLFFILIALIFLVSMLIGVINSLLSI